MRSVDFSRRCDRGRRVADPIRAAVLAAMRTITDDHGMLGMHNFDEHGDATNRIIGICTVHDGKFQLVTQVDQSPVQQ